MSKVILVFTFILALASLAMSGYTLVMHYQLDDKLYNLIDHYDEHIDWANELNGRLNNLLNLLGGN